MIIRGLVAELVTAKINDGAVLDAVVLPRSLVVIIFGDTRGEIMALCI